MDARAEYKHQWYLENRERLRIRMKIHYENTKEATKPQRNANSLAWQKANKEKAKIAHKNYVKRNPWVRVYRFINSRCSSNSRYGKKGIKTELTTLLIKELWIRDKASEMTRPSIDRIDPDGDYTFKNCRFIEMKDNLSRRRFGCDCKCRCHKV